MVSLTFAPLLHPPNYSQDFILYLITSDATINMVLVKEYDLNQEHVIYYHSKGLFSAKLYYSYVEKLALSVIYAIH